MHLGCYNFGQLMALAHERGEAPFCLGDIARVVAWWEREASIGGWEGGFLLRLDDGAYVYLTGWCGEEGWGVQEGVAAITYQDEPHWRDVGFFRVPKHLAKEMGVPTWDRDTADLNRYVTDCATRIE
jgi:hypothetical protein